MSSPNKNMNLYISCLADVGGMFLDMKLHVEWRYKQTKTLQNSIWKHWLLGGSLKTMKQTYHIQI